MSQDQSNNLREQWEVRIVALLLGEASAFETAELQEVLKKDPELAAFHEEMRRTVALVRETTKKFAATPKAEVTQAKLSDHRRQALLARISPPQIITLPAQPSPRAFSRRLMPLAIAAGILLLGTVIALLVLPSSFSARKRMQLAAGRPELRNELSSPRDERAKEAISQNEWGNKLALKEGRERGARSSDSSLRGGKAAERFAQAAPSAQADYDNDGHLDLFVAGRSAQTAPSAQTRDSLSTAAANRPLDAALARRYGLAAAAETPKVVLPSSGPAPASAVSAQGGSPPSQRNRGLAGDGSVQQLASSKLNESLNTEQLVRRDIPVRRSHTAESEKLDELSLGDKSTVAKGTGLASRGEFLGRLIMPGEKQSVAVYDMENANPESVAETLQDMFQFGSSSRVKRSSTAGKELAPLPIALPTPAFMGTPTDIPLPSEKPATQPQGWQYAGNTSQLNGSGNKPQDASQPARDLVRGDENRTRAYGGYALSAPEMAAPAQRGGSLGLESQVASISGRNRLGVVQAGIEQKLEQAKSATLDSESTAGETRQTVMFGRPSDGRGSAGGRSGGVSNGKGDIGSAVADYDTDSRRGSVIADDQAGVAVSRTVTNYSAGPNGSGDSFSPGGGRGGRSRLLSDSGGGIGGGAGGGGFRGAVASAPDGRPSAEPSGATKYDAASKGPSSSYSAGGGRGGRGMRGGGGGFGGAGGGGGGGMGGFGGVTDEYASSDANRLAGVGKAAAPARRAAPSTTRGIALPAIPPSASEPIRAGDAVIANNGSLQQQQNQWYDNAVSSGSGTSAGHYFYADTDTSHGVDANQPQALFEERSKTPALGDVPLLGKTFQTTDGITRLNTFNNEGRLELPQVKLQESAVYAQKNLDVQLTEGLREGRANAAATPVIRMPASPAPALRPSLPASTAGAVSLGYEMAANGRAADTKSALGVEESLGRSSQRKAAESTKLTVARSEIAAEKDSIQAGTEFEMLKQKVAPNTDLYHNNGDGTFTSLNKPAKPEEKSEADLAKKIAPAAIPLPPPELSVLENPLSTFSLNVSDVSFKLVATGLENGTMPDPASIRVEEFINAFHYRDPAPQPGARLAFAWEQAHYPFAHNRDMLRFSIQTAAQGREPGKPLNLVVLLDNSGSMERPDRIQIVQTALMVLAQQLQPQDRISVVAFARTARLWIDGMAGGNPQAFLEKVLDLNPQGGTNLEDALDLAYSTAVKNFLAKGMNRVILLTDGAANLGNVDPEVLKQKVITHRAKGIALDCFGIGWEGYNDDLLEVLSHNGDGRYAFLDQPDQAGPQFANQLAGALNVAAADVKTQVEFNPQRVMVYRQIGYARHQLTKEQFRDNTVDAAEIAAAESGNALYAIEVNPQGFGPIGVVRVRFKVPATGEYLEQAWAIPYKSQVPTLEQSSPAMRLAVAAAAFGEWLSRNPYAGEVTLSALQSYLSGVPETFAPDPQPQRLAGMIRQARAIVGR